jgi:hypothetical protein
MHARAVVAVVDYFDVDVLQVAESAGREPTFELGLISFGVDAVRVDAAEREAAGGAPVLGKNLADGGAKLAPPHHSPRVEVAVVEVERREAPQVVPAAGEPERAVGRAPKLVGRSEMTVPRISSGRSEADQIDPIRRRHRRRCVNCRHGKILTRRLVAD